MIEKTAKFVYDYIFFFLPDGDPWDHVAHFIISFGGVFVLFVVLKLLNTSPKIALLIASLAMLAIGIVKEISDFHLGKTDISSDMITNILSIAAAIAVIILMKLLK